jgi:hypothetical protein
MTGSGNLQEELTQLLTALEGYIKCLPTSLPEGSGDGLIATYLCDHSVDDEEGLFFSFNRSWECVFQRNPAEQEKLIVRGKYGLQLVHSFCVYYAQVLGIADNNGLGLMIMHLRVLLTLIKKV